MHEEIDIPFDLITKVVDRLQASKYAIAFTGAGISVESGIPSFRGLGGLWSKYDPKILELDYFLSYPERSWPVIKEIFYDHFGGALPNAAHKLLAYLEREGLLKCVITQNIDSLHQRAGSHVVHCFHGDSGTLVCLKCNRRFPAEESYLKEKIPSCPHCGGMLKPDFVFFGENIPVKVSNMSFEAAEKADLVLVIGTTGEVYPAALIPQEAKKNGAFIVEINPEVSHFSTRVADVHIKASAVTAANRIAERLNMVF